MSVWQMKIPLLYSNSRNFVNVQTKDGYMVVIDWINKKNQNIKIYNSVSANNWINEEAIDGGIAVLGGNVYQRNAIVEWVIAKCIGGMGVVVLHNNDVLEHDLGQLGKMYPSLLTAYSNLDVCFINNEALYYEPLYGMDINRAAEAVYPELSTDSPMYMQQHLCFEALKKYLKILQYTDRAINLDHLIDLCNLDLDELERIELSRIPQEVAEDILAVLMQENINRQVRVDVNHFAALLDGRIWKRACAMTTVSLIKAVERRALISVKIPSNNVAVLDYFREELNYLIDNHARFLLVVDSIDMKDSRLKDILFNSNQSFFTILSENSNLEIDGSTDGQNSNLLNKVGNIILFRCANVTIARQYSDLIGTYSRKVVSMSDSRQKGPYNFFAGYERGRTISEQDYARITPEALVQLNEGVVLIDQRSGTVSLGKQFVY